MKEGDESFTDKLGVTRFQRVTSCADRGGRRGCQRGGGFLAQGVVGEAAVLRGVGDIEMVEGHERLLVMREV